MKKILTIVLVIACAISLFACGAEPELSPVESVKAMYAASCPTKMETTTVQVINGVTFNGLDTIIAGKVDGKEAVVYTYSYEELQDVEAGADSPIKTVSGTVEYLEGKGMRNNGGAWDAEGQSFAPTPGSIALNITEETVLNMVKEENTFTFDVAAANTAAVLGEENAVNADVHVVITTNGAVVTGVVISYTISATETDPEISVNIAAVYSYDLQTVTLTK